MVLNEHVIFRAVNDMDEIFVDMSVGFKPVKQIVPDSMPMLTSNKDMKLKLQLTVSPQEDRRRVEWL